MNILRLPPYPLTITYDVPNPSTDYFIIIEDSIVNKDLKVSVTSDGNSQVSYNLEGFFLDYDQEYRLTIYEDVAGELGDIVVQDSLNIARPYVNPADIAPSQNDIAAYTQHEELARAIIDDYVGVGFGYRRSIMEVVGQDTDYMPLWERSHKLLYAYENAKLVWDAEQDPSALDNYNYYITRDGSAITKDPINATGEQLNRHEKKQAGTKVNPSDSFTLYDTSDSPVTQFMESGVVFPAGWDYIFVLETGYKVVPMDVKRATEMLIDDIACGKLEYYQRYVTAYSTDQYRVKMDESVLDGTGNILVDKMLAKYVVSLNRPGVL